MNLPKRKTVRLVNYDYSSPGAYFVTICTHERRCVLSTIAVGALHEAPLRQRAARSLLPQTIGYLKMNSSKKIHQLDPELKIWQRSYYEHVIRNEKDYREIWYYIDTNPLRWTEDRYYSE